VGPFINFFNIASIFVGVYGRAIFLEQIMGICVISVLTYIFWVYQIAMQQNINVEVLNQMQEKIEEQSMFKQIINSLEESIVIAQGD
jgi:hypothetical protein